jgi:hypothetical protein
MHYEDCSVRTLRIVAFFTAVLVAASARAETIDLSEFTCKQFAESPKETIDPAIIDFDKAKVTSEKLRSYCVQNPHVGILTAADKLMEK